MLVNLFTEDLLSSNIWNQAESVQFQQNIEKEGKDKGWKYNCTIQL